MPVRVVCLASDGRSCVAVGLDVALEFQAAVTGSFAALQQVCKPVVIVGPSQSGKPRHLCGLRFHEFKGVVVAVPVVDPRSAKRAEKAGIGL